MISILSFLFFTGLVAALTWWMTRHDDHQSSGGYFLGGRSLTFPFIAGSLLLTNLSTEQLVGLNGAAFSDGLCVMVWEVVCVIALVFMAWFFLPRFLRSGVATVPQYLEIRFDHGTQVITNIIFLLAYVGILLPIILYSGARGMIDILGLDAIVGSMLEPSVSDQGPTWQWLREQLPLWLIVWAVGLLGSVYALFGGLRTVAVSDTLNGIGLLAGGLLITGFALTAVGQLAPTDTGGVGGSEMVAGARLVWENQQERFNSVGGPDTSVPFGTIFSGIFLLNLFYWTTNQQIIQRTFGASSLAEGQKGVLLTGALKLLGPLYLVLPGMIAYSLFSSDGLSVPGVELPAGVDVDEHPDMAYGLLVRTVLPGPLKGFFAAAILGAILSSFNSALNSACTLFSLGVYQPLLAPEADEASVVRSGKWFGWIVAICAMSIAPLLAQTESLFGYLQKMNGMYFIPILSVVLVGMLTRRVPAVAAKIALVAGFTAIAVGYFVHPFDWIVASIHEYQFLGIVFAWLIVLMLVIGEIAPRETEFVQNDVGAVDMTPWKGSLPAGCVLIFLVLLIYVSFADFSVLLPPAP